MGNCAGHGLYRYRENEGYAGRTLKDLPPATTTTPTVDPGTTGSRFASTLLLINEKHL